MITGLVNIRREATVELPIYDQRGQPQVTLTVVDTGFEDALTLPTAFIQSLGLPFRGTGRARFADGSESDFTIHDALISWDGQFRPILVNSSDTEPLLGMELLEDYELRIQVRPGGGVFITPLPPLGVGEEPAPVVA